MFWSAVISLCYLSSVCGLEVRLLSECWIKQGQLIRSSDKKLHISSGKAGDFAVCSASQRHFCCNLVEYRSSKGILRKSWNLSLLASLALSFMKVRQFERPWRTMFHESVLQSPVMNCWDWQLISTKMSADLMLLMVSYCHHTPGFLFCPILTFHVFLLCALYFWQKLSKN